MWPLLYRANSCSSILTYNNAGPLQITQSGENLMNGIDRPNIDPSIPL